MLTKNRGWGKDEKSCGEKNNFYFSSLPNTACKISRKCVSEVYCLKCWLVILSSSSCRTASLDFLVSLSLSLSLSLLSFVSTIHRFRQVLQTTSRVEFQLLLCSLRIYRNLFFLPTMDKIVLLLL